MKKEASPWCRVVATVLLGFIITVLSTTVFAWWAAGPLRLQPLVVMVVSAGFRLPLLQGGLAALFLGYMSDVASGGFTGLQLTAFMLVLCSCALAERKLEISSWPFQMMATGAMSLLFHLAVIGGLTLTGRQDLAILDLVWILAIQALLMALTAPVFFAVLESMVKAVAYFWPKGRQAQN